MALKETISTLKKHVQELQRDLEKATGGVKAASQRVRMGTIRLAKVAKVYRKESIAAEKGIVKKKNAIKKTSVKTPPPSKAKKATAKLPKKK